jgi:hypothetical protein
LFGRKGSGFRGLSDDIRDPAQDLEASASVVR